MENIAARRIQRELRDIIESEETKPCGIKAEMIYDVGNGFDLRGEIKGPPGTPYEGGTFVLKIEIPKVYPIEPPLITFVTKIWHANICPEHGHINLDTILQNNWSASVTLRTILLSVQVLLSSPKLDVPQNQDVSDQFQNKPEIFDLTARHWTNVYAGGPSKIKEFDDKVRKAMKLRVPEDAAREILSTSNWNLEEALNILSDLIDNFQYDYFSSE